MNWCRLSITHLPRILSVLAFLLCIFSSFHWVGLTSLRRVNRTQGCLSHHITNQTLFTPSGPHQLHTPLLSHHTLYRKPERPQFVFFSRLEFSRIWFVDNAFKTPGCRVPVWILLLSRQIARAGKSLCRTCTLSCEKKNYARRWKVYIF